LGGAVFGTDCTDYTDSLCDYNRFVHISAINPCNPCLIYTLGKKLMTHPHLFVGNFLSGGISEIGWLHAGLILEFSREIIRGFEIEAVGYFLDALIGGRQQFLGSL
jgi:hypothetical protein